MVKESGSQQFFFYKFDKLDKHRAFVKDNSQYNAMDSWTTKPSMAYGRKSQSVWKRSPIHVAEKNITINLFIFNV